MPRHESRVFRDLRRAEDRVADGITRFAGSMAFVYAHVGWFVGWLILNLGLVGAEFVFDAFPFGFLTMVVSLEAIFLSTFVMISQNRQSQRADVRSQLDYERDVTAGVWAEAIGRKLGIDPDAIEADARKIVEKDT